MAFKCPWFPFMHFICELGRAQTEQKSFYKQGRWGSGSSLHHWSRTLQRENLNLDLLAPSLCPLRGRPASWFSCRRGQKQTRVHDGLELQQTRQQSSYHVSLWLFVFFPLMNLGFPGGSDTQESASSTGDPGSISGSGRSPGERSDELNGNLASVNSQGWWEITHCVFWDSRSFSSEHLEVFWLSLGASDVESSESIAPRIVATDRKVMVDTKVFPGLLSLLNPPSLNKWHCLAPSFTCPLVSAVLDRGEKAGNKIDSAQPLGVGVGLAFQKGHRYTVKSGSKSPKWMEICSIRWRLGMWLESALKKERSRRQAALGSWRLSWEVKDEREQLRWAGQGPKGRMNLLASWESWWARGGVGGEMGVRAGQGWLRQVGFYSTISGKSLKDFKQGH